MSASTIKAGDRVRDEQARGTVIAVRAGKAWVMWDGEQDPITENMSALRLVPPFEPVERWVSITSDGEPYQDIYRTQAAAPSDAVRCVVVPAETWEQMTQGTS